MKEVEAVFIDTKNQKCEFVFLSSFDDVKKLLGDFEEVDCLELFSLENGHLDTKCKTNREEAAEFVNDYQHEGAGFVSLFCSTKESQKSFHLLNMNGMDWNLESPLIEREFFCDSILVGTENSKLAPLMHSTLFDMTYYNIVFGEKEKKARVEEIKKAVYEYSLGD